LHLHNYECKIKSIYSTKTTQTVLMNNNTTEKSPEILQQQLEETLKYTEQLKAQLLNTSMVNELTRVLQSCTSIDNIISTVLLGIQDIIGFDRGILFGIDVDNFRLTSRSWVGLEEKDVSQLTIPLGFEGGDITDSIFLNRHIIVNDPTADFDIFAEKLQSPSYLVIPLVAKTLKRCFEAKNCNNVSCPAHGGHNPFCWSIPGAGTQKAQSLTEDERRRQCIACSNFKCEGVIWLDKAVKKTPITSDEITMLTAILNVAGIIIENLRIFHALETTNDTLNNTNRQLKVVNRDLQIAQAKINNDLDRARKIQLGLLPQNVADTTGFSIGVNYIPAAAVGGDYYDVFEIEPGVFGIIVADVSGHGIASALIMSMVKVLLKTHAFNTKSPQKTLELINQTFQTEIKSDNFVTIFYAVLDTNKQNFSYTSAGHCPSLLLNKETHKCDIIKADGLFLGVFDDMMLNETTTSYTPGKLRLILYTDGLTEEKNDANEMFELERLESIAIKTIELPSKEALEKILAFQKEFCGENKEPGDDITLLVIDF